MGPPIKTRPSFPLSQSLPSGSFHKPLILIHQRADNENQNHRKLTKLITWTTALSSSIRLWAMPCREGQDGRVMAESSDKTWSTGERNGNPLQYSCLENPMSSLLLTLLFIFPKELIYSNVFAINSFFNICLSPFHCPQNTSPLRIEVFV